MMATGREVPMPSLPARQLPGKRDRGHDDHEPVGTIDCIEGD
jgi:hypothetical protein